MQFKGTLSFFGGFVLDVSSPPAPSGLPPLPSSRSMLAKYAGGREQATAQPRAPQGVHTGSTDKSTTRVPAPTCNCLPTCGFPRDGSCPARGRECPRVVRHRDFEREASSIGEHKTALLADFLPLHTASPDPLLLTYGSPAAVNIYILRTCTAAEAESRPMLRCLHAGRFGQHRVRSQM